MVSVTAEASIHSKMAASWLTDLLPSDLLPLILQHLRLREVVRASRICKAFQQPVGEAIGGFWMPARVVAVPRSEGAEQLVNFVAALPDGDLLVSDSKGGGVRKLSLSPGRDASVVRHTWDSAALGIGHDIHPSGLAVVGDRFFVACTSTLTAYEVSLGGDSPARDLLRTNGRRHPGRASRLRFPLGCACSAETGRVYLVDSDDHRVVALDTSAAEPSSSTSPHGAEEDISSRAQSFGRGRLKDPYGVAVHAGRLYVSDSGNDRLCIFSEAASACGDAGAFLGCVRWADGGTVQFADPSGVAFTSGGRLLVAETAGALRIFALERDGVTVDHEMQRLLLAPRRALGGVCVDEAASPPRVVVTDTTQGVLHVLEPAALSNAGGGGTGLDAAADAPLRTIHHARKASKRC